MFFCRLQSHIEQEKRQHAFEQIAGKRLHRNLAGFSGHQAHHHRSQQQQLRAVGK